MESIVYVGMDVHKATFSLCAIDSSTGEIVGETKCASDPKMVLKFIEGLAQKCDPETIFETGYEAGCLGYSLYRSLTKLGITCVIMAPTTMFSSAKNKMIKNDTMDAKMIARNLVAKSYHAVYVPDQEDDETKEYLRLRKATKKALTRIKQQLNAIALRHGFQYTATKTKWTDAHLIWFRTLLCSNLLRETIDEFLTTYEELTEKIDRYDKKIELISHSERYEKPVHALTCFKGISVTAAMTIQVEIADFTRFPKAPALMSYVGLNPSEHSSGDKTNKGSITKQGNSIVRTTLIECTQALVSGHLGHKSKKVKDRQVGQPESVIRYADKGAQHLQRKYRRMIEQGKQRNIAIAAVAREFSGFIWGMENECLN